jgi:hypothetical protein
MHVQARKDCQNIKRRSLISSGWIYWYDPFGVYLAIGNQPGKIRRNGNEKTIDHMASKQTTKKS